MELRRFHICRFQPGGGILRLLRAPIIITTALFILMSGRAFCEDYPGTTISLVPSIQAGVSIPLSDTYTVGGVAGTGFSVQGLFTEMLEIGFSGEYYFHCLADDTAPGFAGLGLNAGYTLPIGAWLSLTPGAGLRFILPAAPEPELFLAASAGGRLNLHIFERSKLYIDASILMPFTAEQPFSLRFNLGMLKSNPVMLPLPQVKPEMSLSTRLFSPDGDGENDSLDILLTAKKVSSVKYWRLEIIDKNSRTVFARAGFDGLPESIQWDGFHDNGDFVLSADDYSVKLTVIDKIDRTDIITEDIVIDVLLRLTDGKIRINVPNIIFPPQSADFSLLTEKNEIDKNKQIISRLAEIFTRFSRYSILIEGHANSEHWETEEGFRSEQESELIPLSLSRAESIREKLIDAGIEAERISVTGLGAAAPIIDFADAQNNWKNRRVEFILVK